MLNSNKISTRFVIARSKHQALHILSLVISGEIKIKNHLFQTRDLALVKRNSLREKYRRGYQVFEVPYNTARG